MAKYQVTNCNPSYRGNFNGVYDEQGVGYLEWRSPMGWWINTSGSRKYYMHTDGNKFLVYFPDLASWWMFNSDGLGPDDDNDYRKSSSSISIPTGNWDTINSYTPNVALYQKTGSGSNTVSLSQTIVGQKITYPDITHEVVLTDEAIAIGYVDGDNDLLMTDDLLLNGIFTRAVDNEVVLSQIASGKLWQLADAENDLVVTDSVDFVREVPLDINQNLVITDEVAKYVLYYLEPINTVNLTDSVDGYRAIYRTLISEILLTHDVDAFRQIPRIVVDEIVVTQEVDFSTITLISSITISDSAEAFITKSLESNLELTDSLVRNPMTFYRSVANTVSLSHIVSQYNAGASPYGDCSGAGACTRDHVTFSWGDYSIDLRNPNEDNLQIVLNTINQYTRGEELHTNGEHPRFLQLNYTFTSIPASQKNEFINFYKLSAGMEIILTDFCNQQWLGCILDHDIDIQREGSRLELNEYCPETDDGLYTFSLLFEGERI